METLKRLFSWFYTFWDEYEGIRIYLNKCQTLFLFIDKA